MRSEGVSSTLTVFHDGQFWVGVVEHVEDGRYGACRVVFGAEPSTEELLQFVLRRWGALEFTAARPGEADALATSPKRRQRQAAREACQRGPSTKAQLALGEERERSHEEARADRSREARVQAEARFAQRAEKRKRKRRGH